MYVGYTQKLSGAHIHVHVCTNFLPTLILLACTATCMRVRDMATHLVTWSPGHLVTWSPGHLVTWLPCELKPNYNQPQEKLIIHAQP